MLVGSNHTSGYNSDTVKIKQKKSNVLKLSPGWLDFSRNCFIMRTYYWPLLGQVCHFIVAATKSVFLPSEGYSRRKHLPSSFLSSARGCVDLCQYTDHTHPSS